ncbi:MAG: Ribonuclease P protein component [uncultured bacterium]|nr:MAG: Ribonuclease P protein component [uncultured bacterium]
MSKFSRTSRLVKADIDFVFAKPNKITRHPFVVFYRSNTQPFARLGIVITKQAVKLAVDRNKLRRYVRESFRQSQERLKGLDIVVLVRSECTALEKNILRDKIDHLWQALNQS